MHARMSATAMATTTKITMGMKLATGTKTKIAMTTTTTMTMMIERASVTDDMGRLAEVCPAWRHCAPHDSLP